MKKRIALFILVLNSVVLLGQTFNYYRYDSDLLSKEFHKGRREALRSEMPSNSVAVFFSNPVRNRSNDNDHTYHQDPNFYYLTGFTEPNAVLIILKNELAVNGVITNEIIYVPDNDPLDETWNGRRAGTEGASQLLGIATVKLTSGFDSLDLNFKSLEKLLYRLPQGVVNEISENSDLYDLIESFKKKSNYPSENGDTRLLQKLMAGLREIKQPEEIALLKKSIEMSTTAHIEMMRKVEPGMTEYQVQAVGEYVFMKKGAEYVGYPSICGGGENSTILHYNTNRKTLTSADLILLDMGAEYHGYCADITRTIPVSGQFTIEQKIIYDLVLKAQEAGIAQCNKGNFFNDPHKAASSVIQDGLLELGIIKEKKDFKNYFMHATSHYLGLDVHDLGTFSNLTPGNVITVEPGIYIPEGSPCNPKWWNIGVRIEDDILITENGFVNLSVAVPKTTNAIESEMKKSPDFIK